MNTDNVIQFNERRQQIRPAAPVTADQLLQEFVGIMDSPISAEERRIQFAAWSMQVMGRYGALPSQKAAAKRKQEAEARSRKIGSTPNRPESGRLYELEIEESGAES